MSLPRPAYTTILRVRGRARVAGGDGQVTLGSSVMKADAESCGGCSTARSSSASPGTTTMPSPCSSIRGKLKDSPATCPGQRTELAENGAPTACSAVRPWHAMVDAAASFAHHRHRRRDPADRRRAWHRIRRQLRGGRRPPATLAHSDLVPQPARAQVVDHRAGINIYTNTNINVEELPGEPDAPADRRRTGSHIVGQHDAKRVVAIATRHRWRRQQLSNEMQ